MIDLARPCHCHRIAKPLPSSVRQEHTTMMEMVLGVAMFASSNGLLMSVELVILGGNDDTTFFAIMIVIITNSLQRIHKLLQEYFL